MFHLLLATCLAADPATCSDRLLPAAESSTAEECRRKAEPIARDWLARHPGLRGGEAHCVETAALPALPVQEIADDVFFRQGAIEQLSRQNRGRIANLAFVVGDSVAVIDAGATRAEGEELYAAIRAATDKPVSHLILTHMHPDHILGAEVFAEAGASIVANSRLPDAVSRRTDAWMLSIPAQIGPEAFMGTRVAPVDQLVDAPMTIPLGGTELLLEPRESAHTDNDLTVTDTDSGTFFAGDLIFRGLTPSLDGSLSNWIDWTQNGAPDPAPRIVVPGHGPVAETWEEAVAPQREYLLSLRETTRKVIAGGLPLSRAIPAIVSLMKPDSAGWADFDATTARNAATSFSQLEWE